MSNPQSEDGFQMVNDEKERGMSWHTVLDFGPAGETLCDLKCPLTGVIMHNPVRAEDGVTYERAGIEKWLLSNDTSPIVQDIVNDNTTGKPRTVPQKIGNSLVPDDEKAAAISRILDEVIMSETPAEDYVADTLSWPAWGLQSDPRKVELNPVPTSFVRPPNNEAEMASANEFIARLSTMFEACAPTTHASTKAAARQPLPSTRALCLRNECRPSLRPRKQA